MAITPTYPGVYVEEVPSGVRTIVGVGTSTALFIGRTKTGQLMKPQLCLSATDFVRKFSNDTTYGELPRAVNLFYANGGTTAWIMRIANNAVAASINLLAEDGATVVLTATAISAGTLGNNIRIGVTYNSQDAEGAFDLEVFDWQTTPTNQRIKADREFYPNLSMDPNAGRYAPRLVNAASALIQLTDPNAAVALAGNGTSRSGRPLLAAGFVATVQPLICSLAATNKLMIGVDGNPYVSVDFSGLQIGGAGITTVGQLAAAMALAINGAVAPSVVTVDVVADGANNFLRINSANGDVRIIPAGAGDLAGPLMFGPGQGGLERPRSSPRRPAPTGAVFAVAPTDANLFTFADSLQNTITAMSINGFGVPVNLVTTVGGDPMLRDNLAGSVTGNSDGVREKFALMATAVNNAAAATPAFAWSGSVAGSRLVVTPTAGPDDAVPVLAFGVSASQTITITAPALGDTINVTITPPAGAAVVVSYRVTAADVAGGQNTLAASLAAAINASAANAFLRPATLAANIITLTCSAPGGNAIGLATAVVGPPGTTGAVRGGANFAGGTSFASTFDLNARYYNLGRTAAGPFQTSAAVASDGGVPQLADYANAYPIIDKNVDLFNLMVLPRDAGHNDATAAQLNGPASTFCQKRRALLIVDAPFNTWAGANAVQDAIDPTTGVSMMRTGVIKDTSALFFPRVQIVEGAGKVYVGASGAVAGIMARIDGTRGVWKAPAGTEADVRSIVGIETPLTDTDNGVLNPRAINTIRNFPDGIVVWGSRTMDGDDNFGSEYKYVPVRRMAYFLEESLYRGLKWVVFEPNDEPLWAQIRLNVGAFMHEQFRKGAFAGATPKDAYFVKCDHDTTTQNDQNLGIVNIVVGFAPLKPAEFVLIHLQQMAGQIGV